MAGVSEEVTSNLKNLQHRLAPIKRMFRGHTGLTMPKVHTNASESYLNKWGLDAVKQRVWGKWHLKMWQNLCHASSLWCLFWEAISLIIDNPLAEIRWRRFLTLMSWARPSPQKWSHETQTVWLAFFCALWVYTWLCTSCCCHSRWCCVTVVSCWTSPFKLEEKSLTPSSMFIMWLL